jgi:LuxR family transcriptional regulator, quorum-sensing system regulator SdiA
VKSGLLDFLESVTAATSLETIWSRLTEAMEAHGFDRLIYGFTRYRTAQSLGNPEDLLILTNHDRTYTDRFIGQRLYVNAPMVRWAAENTGACSWRWVSEHSEHLSAEERKVVHFNRQSGVVAGYSISFPAISHRSKGAMALTARPGLDQDSVDAIWRENGELLLQMANVAHLKIITLPYTGTRRPLTERQREALEWVGDGKTTQDIATIMGLTPATVEKHLRLAREALDVDTTAQAVLKASFQNQIFVVPQPGAASPAMVRR